MMLYGTGQPKPSHDQTSVDYSTPCHAIVAITIVWSDPELQLDLPFYPPVGCFTLRERQNSRVRVEVAATDAGGRRRRLACKSPSLAAPMTGLDLT